uniref:Uncharacterized protein n=1 Tax=Arundo donax TaxID=35708 RepID=A0A0A9EIK8_ARUDO
MQEFHTILTEISLVHIRIEKNSSIPNRSKMENFDARHVNVLVPATSRVSCCLTSYHTRKMLKYLFHDSRMLREHIIILVSMSNAVT